APRVALDRHSSTRSGEPVSSSDPPLRIQQGGGRRMNLVTIAWKSIRQRWLASLLKALSIALGVALMVTGLVMNCVVTSMFSQSATGYHLIIGAKGSPMQLVLNTIYFMDRPIENVPYTQFLKLKKKSWVKHAIPFNLGNTTEDG